MSLFPSYDPPLWPLKFGRGGRRKRRQRHTQNRPPEEMCKSEGEKLRLRLQLNEARRQEHRKRVKDDIYTFYLRRVMPADYETDFFRRLYQ